MSSDSVPAVKSMCPSRGRCEHGVGVGTGEERCGQSSGFARSEEGCLKR